MTNIFELQIHEGLKMKRALGLTPIQEFTNDFLASSITKFLLYPLDVAQILMQTNAEDSREGLFQTILHLHRTHGITSLYRGQIASCTISCLLGIGSFLGGSPLLRDKASTPLARFFVSAGITTAIFPLQVAKIRMIARPAKYKSTWETIECVYKEEELPALYKGLSVSILMILINMAATAASVKAISAVWKKPRSDMTYWENVAFGFLTVVLSGLIQYPIDSAVKIVQSTPHDSDNVLRTLLNTGKIPRATGMSALFRGFSANLIKPLAIPLEWKISDLLRSLLFR